MSLAVIVNLIEATRTAAGLRVRCELDRGAYPKGRDITDTQMATLSLEQVNGLLGRFVPEMGILEPMTRALDAAIAKLATLSADEQDRIAQWLLDELSDEEHWTRQFSASQEALSRLAAEARSERAAGRATELDPDNL